MTEEVATLVATPAAPPPAAAPTGAPAGETPATPAAEAPQTPPGATPEPIDAEKAERARHRRKLDTAYRKAAEAQARAEFFEKQYNEVKVKAAPETDAGEPKLEDFKSIEEYGAAVKKYASDKTLKDHTEKQRTESNQREIAELAKSWSDKAELGAEKYDDWDQIVGEVKPHAPWSVAAMEADNAADVMYYLGKDNAKEARRIAALPPRSQIREIGKIEAKLAAEPPKPKTPSKAPAPITPLTGAATVATDVPSEQDDMRTWIRKRNKQLGRK